MNKVNISPRKTKTLQSLNQCDFLREREGIEILISVFLWKRQVFFFPFFFSLFFFFHCDALQLLRAVSLHVAKKQQHKGCRVRVSIVLIVSMWVFLKKRADQFLPLPVFLNLTLDSLWFCVFAMGYNYDVPHFLASVPLVLFELIWSTQAAKQLRIVPAELLTYGTAAAGHDALALGVEVSSFPTRRPDVNYPPEKHDDIPPHAVYVPLHMPPLPDIHSRMASDLEAPIEDQHTIQQHRTEAKIDVEASLARLAEADAKTSGTNLAHYDAARKVTPTPVAKLRATPGGALNPFLQPLAPKEGMNGGPVGVAPAAGVPVPSPKDPGLVIATSDVAPAPEQVANDDRKRQAAFTTSELPQEEEAKKAKKRQRIDKILSLEHLSGSVDYLHAEAGADEEDDDKGKGKKAAPKKKAADKPAAANGGSAAPAVQDNGAGVGGEPAPAAAAAVEAAPTAMEGVESNPPAAN